MDKAYGSRWSTAKGAMTDKDVPTKTFIEWAEGTAHLEDKNWAYGIARIDMKMRADAANNKDSFPPETPVIWCSWCFPPEVANHLKDQTAGASKLSHMSFKDPRHPSYRPPCIESDEHKAKKKKVGNATLNSIKDML